MCPTQQLVGAVVCAKIGASAAYPDELDWLSKQVSGAESPAEPRAGTPRGVNSLPSSQTHVLINIFNLLNSFTAL